MGEKFRTLVVDDETGIRFFLKETLQKAGHDVATASNGEQALDQLRATRFDLIMLDLKLGGRVDGLRVLEAVRWRWPDTVVIIITGHGSLDSAMAAIREGVDGYLLKPVEPQELRRAVREALDRRSKLARSTKTGDEEQFVRRGPFSVHLKKHLVTMHGEPLELTPREFRLLTYLLQNAHRAVPPKELVRAVQGYECDSLHEARQIIKWYIHRLRRKVEPEPSHPRHILNVRGVGYRYGE
jgi:DNA-binding response OmpR family regulator